MNKNNNRGFSIVEFIMIMVVLIIVGVFVFFASKNKQSDLSVKEQTNNVVQNNSTENNQPSEQDQIVSLVRQLATDAETRYNGSYKQVFMPANENKENGSGIVLSNGSVGSKVVDEAKSKSSQIFAITNDNITAYAIYSKLPGTPVTYYCLASDGSKKTVSQIVDINGLSKKPICK